MIVVKNLCKHYRATKAVDDISFQVQKGEVVGFLGPNGAGKTTTMKMITSAIPPTSGSIEIQNINVFENPGEVKKKIGYLPEVPPLYPDMTVNGYLHFMAEIKGVPRKKVLSEIERVVQKTCISDVIDRIIANISKGYKQRVGLAQALLGDPELLILDEPTAGLDPLQIIEVRELIQNLSGDHTIILSTHILQEVTAVCQRIIIISRGKLVADAPIEQLVNTYQKPLEQIFVELAV